MSPTFIITRREFRSNFDSPIAYVVIILSLMIVSVFVFQQFWTINRATISPLFGYLPWLLNLLVIPAVTMRLFAEEKRTGTIELLITMPVRDRDVVIGKFLATLGLVVVLLALTLTYPITISRLGNLDAGPWYTLYLGGPVATGYLGLVLEAAAGISIGLFFSSRTENQIVALFATFIVLLILTVLDFVGPVLGGEKGMLGDIFSFISFQRRLSPFTRGLLDLRNVIYFLSITAFFLVATVRSLESRKWK
jgi:ABC-2 type transport system permease protein